MGGGHERTLRNVLPVDGDEIVSVSPALFMVEAEGVVHLMLDGPVAGQAPGALVVDLLGASNPA